MRNFFIALIVLALGLVGCGDDVTTVTEVTQVVGMKVVEEGDALPKCNTENEGAMVYSVDSAAAFYCINRKWTSIRGKDGADGKDGKNGENGKDGKNGTDGKNGADGDNGIDGKNCEVVSDTNGVITLMCGADTTTLYKAMCDLTPYDPTRQYCSVQGIFDLKKCGGKLYNPESRFCDTRDSSLYRYVTIGSQVWMAENLNYKVDSSFCYNDSVEYCEKYGRLYKWAAAVGKSEEECGDGYDCGLSGKIRGVCPEGWHLPDTTEWKTLFTAVGGIDIAGEILRPQTGWNSNIKGTDAYGFSAFPAGNRNYDGVFNNRGDFACFWSVTEYESNYAYFMIPMDFYGDGAYLDRNSKSNAFSVRCLKY